MPVRKSIFVVVSVVAMLAATFAAINVLAQEPAPSPLPPPAGPEVFFSGPVIDGPGFCWYRSLGGQRTYAFDHDDGGVAETCSLPSLPAGGGCQAVGDGTVGPKAIRPVRRAIQRGMSKRG